MNVIKFINIYKEKQLWENLDINNRDKIIIELKNNYTSLLKTIIYTGRVLLLIF